MCAAALSPPLSLAAVRGSVALPGTLPAVGAAQCLPCLAPRGLGVSGGTGTLLPGGRRWCGAAAPRKSRPLRRPDLCRGAAPAAAGCAPPPGAAVAAARGSAGSGPAPARLFRRRARCGRRHEAGKARAGSAGQGRLGKRCPGRPLLCALPGWARPAARGLAPAPPPRAPGEGAARKGWAGLGSPRLGPSGFGRRCCGRGSAGGRPLKSGVPRAGSSPQSAGSSLSPRGWFCRSWVAAGWMGPCSL